MFSSVSKSFTRYQILNVLNTQFFNLLNTQSVSSVILALMNNPFSSILASITVPIGLSMSCCNNTIGFVMYCLIVSSNADGSTISFMRSLSFVDAYHSISYAFESQSMISFTDFLSHTIWKNSLSLINLNFIFKILWFKIILLFRIEVCSGN